MAPFQMILTTNGFTPVPGIPSRFPGYYTLVIGLILAVLPQITAGSEAKPDFETPPATSSHWAFQPLRSVPPPTATDPDWSRTPIDLFISRSQQAAHVSPSAPADRRRLIRRVYLDMLGMPPPPPLVESFVNNLDPRAYEELIDTVLASPHYGERWGRYWLDLARFAESHGFEHDTDRPTAYPYRDFVIRALNQDMPYDQFVRWQIAGDEFAPTDPMALTATGFLAAGVHSTQITANQAEKERYDELDDIVSTIGTSMLGLTIGCARCHDHKYDPIPSIDYYRLLSTFTTTVRTEIDLNQIAASPSAATIPAQPPEEKTDPSAKPGPSPSKALICSEGLPPLRLASQGPDFYPKTYFLKRGDPNQKDGEVSQGFLRVLMHAPAVEQTWQLQPPEGWRTSYRRRGFAEWITDVPQGAGSLLARVIVNRLWQHHFGTGLVSTSGDFGAQGEKPSHPELLEWLANELIRLNWQLKPIHRLILKSASYRQDSQLNPAAARIDPDNRLLWRFPPRRLESEAIRDSILAVTRLLDSRMFGPGSLDPDDARRSIYLTVKRSKLNPMMVLFDGPDTLQSQGHRTATTVAPQALLLLNNPQVHAWARSLGRRVFTSGEKSLTTAVRNSFNRILGREPDPEELRASLQFLEHQRTGYTGAEATAEALGDLCQGLLSLNEFVYLN